MKVRATQLGFAGDRRRREGDIFDIPEHLFSSRWMEKVDEEEDVKPRRGRKPKEAEEVDQGE